MCIKQNAINLKFNFINIVTLIVFVHFYCELMAVMSEIVGDIEGLRKALCMPALLGLSIDIESDQTTSQVVFNRYGSSMAS